MIKIGCDIHSYVEIEEHKNYVSNLAKITLSRDYLLFGLLAGVRVLPEEFGAKLLFEPRGLPEVNSDVVNVDNNLYVIEDNDKDTEKNSCNRSMAELWVKQGKSKWVFETKHIITHPDWHTHSYLYVDELKEIQKQYSTIKEKECKFIGENEEVPLGYEIIETIDKTKMIEAKIATPLGPHLELAAIISMMETINKGNPKRSRFTFWFDN